MRRTILLNPGPVTTTNRVKQALLVEDICHRETTFTLLLKEIQDALLELARADESYSCVLFASSGTGAIEACISSLIPPNKTLAVINNGAYGQRIIDIAKRYAIPVMEFAYSPDTLLPLSKIERIIEQNSLISHVALVHHETSTGLLNPLQAIGEICHRHQRCFIVDAMSSFAGADIDVHRDHIDFMISSSNKCVQGMPGIAFVIGKTKMIIDSQPVARSYYFDLYQQLQALKTTGQLPYTPPVQILYALKQALLELQEETILGRMQRYHDNYDCLVAGLESLGYKNITPSNRESKLLLTIACPKDTLMQFDELHDALFKEGFTIYPAKNNAENTFRLACIGDLKRCDIEKFLACLKSIIV